MMEMFGIIGFLSKFRTTLMLLCFFSLFFISKALFNSDRVYILLFPGADSEYNGLGNFSQLYIEQRKVPIPKVLPTGWDQQEREIYYLLKELVYGPGPRIIYSYPFISTDTKINNLVIEQQNLYVDFNAKLVEGKSEHYFGTNEVLALMKKVVRLNFPHIKNIFFTVDGLDIRLFRSNLENRPTMKKS